MRHQVRGRKLGRTASHRKATMRALSTALITHHRIVTTLAKAKELRRYIEPVITKAIQGDTTHNRRQIFSFLNDKRSVTMLYDDVAPVVGDRKGGYTRVVKLGNRAGDGAPTALIELVDFNDVAPEGKAPAKKRTRRAGRKKSTDGDTAQTETAAETKPETEEAKPKAQTKSKPNADADKAEAKSADDTEAKDQSSSEETEEKKG